MITTETLIAFDKLPAYLGKLTGKRPHKSSCHRWRTRGLKGVRLETILVGGTRFTSKEALNRFFLATTAAADKARGNAISNGMARANRERQIAEAEAQLDAAGI